MLNTPTIKLTLEGQVPLSLAPTEKEQRELAAHLKAILRRECNAYLLNSFALNLNTSPSNGEENK